MASLVSTAPDVTAVTPAETVEATSPSGSNSSGDNEPPTPPKMACFACKKRRITCDQSYPACRKCAKKGIVCPGYTKPKIVWKVLKLHSVESRDWQRVEAVGQSRTSPERSSTHGGGGGGGGGAGVGGHGGSTSGPGRRTRNARPGKKPPLLDIGYTFKVDFPSPLPTPSATGALTPPESHAGSASPPPHQGNTDNLDDLDTDVELIPRIVDPYNSSLDRGSRETLTYYETKICLTLEYLRPLDYLSSLTITGPAVSGGNPLKYLITQASQCPILLNSMLAISLRHWAILLEAKGSGVGRPDPYGAQKTLSKALVHHQKSISLLRQRMASANPVNISEVDSETEKSPEMARMELAYPGPKNAELWKRDDNLMLMLLMLYYEMIDGGTGNGSWKWHLQFAKWLIEMREANGLGMGAKDGPDVSFIRVHLETFDVVGSSFAGASRLFPQDLWLQPSPHEASHGLCTPSATSGWDSYPFHPYQILHETINDPDPVYPFALLFIPSSLRKIIHHINNTRRQNYLSPDQVQTQAHDLLLIALNAFNPELWSAARHTLPIRFTPSGPERPASQYPVTYWEEVALGRAYHLSVQIYFHLALNIPYNNDPAIHVLVDKLVTELIPCIQMINSSSLLFRSMVWPTMLAGIAAFTEDQMLFLRDYGLSLRRSMPCQGLTKGLKALERLWAAKPPSFHEKRIRTGGRRVDWEATLAEFKGDWLVI